MKKCLTMLSAAAMLGLGSLAAQAADIARVVYHVDYADPDRYSLTLTSVNNMLNAYEQDLREYDVEIVFVGPGARFVTNDKKAGTDKRLEAKRAELKGRLEALNKVRGVKLKVCNNTLSDMGIAKEALYPGVEVVPSGVAYIADQQAKGAAYLKIQ
ncbi:MAG: DsrE family protein [Halothiobacillaceae bacterium]